MRIPYNRVHVRGQVIFAARGGRIHTFRLSDGYHIATWEHPHADKSSAAEAVELTQEGPPAKRLKLTAEDAKGEDSAVVQKHYDGRGKRKARKGQETDDAGGGWDRLARVPGRPIVTHLTTSEDGRLLLAVTGHDKAIWVLEHDGEGHLTQLSQRIMPKRPSSVAVVPHDSHILSADKFGDVYALPLVASPPGSGAATPSVSALRPPGKKAFRPSANALTVHSKGNLRALENQLMQAELDRRQQDAQDGPAQQDGPDPGLSLLLGHVSMLTCVTYGEAQGRRYILTADRDEHIRVSRYMPQAHIIETFCLGHKEFISDMIIVPSSTQHQGVLVSGGGDDFLFLWDWLSGKLSSKTDILSLAQDVAPDTTKVAVSGLYTLRYPADEGEVTYLLAICEGVKAIFSWRFRDDDNALDHPGIIPLPGRPLQLAVSTAQDERNRMRPVLIAAIDPDRDADAKSLHSLTLTTVDGTLTVTKAHASVKDEALEVQEAEVSEDEVRHLLYTVESLRKLSTSFLLGDDSDNGGGGDDDDQGEKQAAGTEETEA